MPTNIILFLLEDLKTSLPGMRRIFENSPRAIDRLDTKFDKYVKRYDTVKAMCGSGELTKTSPWPTSQRVLSD